MHVISSQTLALNGVEFESGRMSCPMVQVAKGNFILFLRTCFAMFQQASIVIIEAHMFLYSSLR